MSGTDTAPWAWSNTSQLSSVSPGQMPLQVRQGEFRLYQDWTGESKGLGSHGPGSPATACRPHLHPQAKWHLEAVWKRFGSRKFQRAGGLQEAFNGSRCLQAATRLVGHGLHRIQKLVQNEIDPESSPRSGLCWGRSSSWCHSGKKSWPLYWVRGRGQRLPHCARFNIKVQGTDLWLGRQHPWALAHALQEHAT